MPALHSPRLVFAFVLALASLVVLFPRSATAAEGMQVLSVSPAARSLTPSINAALTVEFDRPVDPASVNADSFWGFGKWSGTVHGTFSFTTATAP